MEFTVLGSIGLVAERGTTTINGSRQRTLLALLAVRAGTVVTKEQLFDELWGASVPTGADNALQALVTRLRRVLSRSSQVVSAQEYLATRPAGYLLDVEREQVDAHRFVGLTRRARLRMADDPVTAKSLLEQALALWQGSALSGVVGGPICQGAAEEFEEARLAAAEDWIRVTINLCGHSAVISELRRLVSLHPWRERFLEVLMVCLYRSGRQAEAIQAYHRARRRLLDEFGMEPSPDVKRCMTAILNQGAGAHGRPNPRPAAVGHAMPR
jgi:SARP family transcriptional regulator, regulator of embCAB operon